MLSFLCHAHSVVPYTAFRPPAVFCAECGCEVDPAAWLCANCGSQLHVPGAMTSTSPYVPESLMHARHVHGRARAAFRFFLYMGSIIMFIALTWGQDFPGDDQKTAIASHFLIVCISLLIVIGEAVALHSYDLLTSKSSETDQSLGEEIFSIVLFAGFWSLYAGLRWHTLPAAVYAKHLEGSLFAVFIAAFLIILWDVGIFDRRQD